MTTLERIKGDLKTDETLRRAQSYSRSGLRALPSATVGYVLDKVPIIQWLPRYNPKWILNDFVAGLTIGIMLVPQGLAYAKIATIPVQYGLMSSWLPALIYSVMGTSKDLSTGPTSILGLLTAEIIKEVKDDGYAPQEIASAVAMMVGVYSLAMGLLNLGFLLDFISVPVLTSFISAAAIVIGLGQVPSLLGEDNVGSGTATIIHDLFAELPNANPRAVAVGLSGIVLLSLLQYAGGKWGKRFKAVWLLGICRAAIAIILYTGISYGLNKNRDEPVFALSKVTANGIATPKIPDLKLVGKVAVRSVAPFVAAVLEHNAIGKAFGAKNGYAIDTTQELCYVGVTNFFNSWFSAMGVGGAMSRTAVNSESGVKSPLSGIFTAGFVLLGIYKLTGALYWIPKATLAAIIVTAVYHLILSMPLYYFWRTSFLDFIAAMITFWVTLFVSAETGIAAGVAFSIGCMLIRTAFARVTTVTSKDTRGSTSTPVADILDDTRVFSFNEAILFPNAGRTTAALSECVQTFNSGAYQMNRPEDADRSWSVSAEKRIASLRARYNIHHTPCPIRTVILDFTKVTYIDTTGLLGLVDFKRDLRKFGGKDVELKFSTMNEGVRRKFERARWELADADASDDALAREDVDLVFESVSHALRWTRRVSSSGEDLQFGKG